MDDPWIESGDQWAEHEGSLIGNRTGLEALKKDIEKALEAGQCDISVANSNYIKLKLLDEHPDKGKKLKQTWADKGCLVVVAAVIFVFLCGMIHIVQMFT